MDHGGTREPTRVLGGVDFGTAAMLDVLSLHVAWYDWVMKGGPRPEALRDRFVYYLAGANRWESLPAMPGREQRQVLFLSSVNRTADTLPDRGELTMVPLVQPRDVYRYNPGLPARNEGIEAGEAVSANFLTDPRSFAVLHGDGLIYDSAPFAARTRLIGRPATTLQLAMDVPDTDIRVQLFLVHRDGSVLFLAQDQIRARYRHDSRRAELVPFGTENMSSPIPLGGNWARNAASPRHFSIGNGIHQQRNRNREVSWLTKPQPITALPACGAGTGRRLLIPASRRCGVAVTQRVA